MDDKLNELLSKAIIIATEAHKGQVDKGSQNYILHPLRVMSKVKSLKGKIVAVLHDTIEDTHITKEHLLDMGFPYEIVEAVELLSKPRQEDYLSYVARVGENELAKEVKIADLEDNMDTSRLKEITEKDLKRVEKYKKAHSILLNKR